MQQLRQRIHLSCNRGSKRMTGRQVRKYHQRVSLGISLFCLTGMFTMGLVWHTHTLSHADILAEEFLFTRLGGWIAWRCCAWQVLGKLMTYDSEICWIPIPSQSSQKKSTRLQYFDEKTVFWAYFIKRSSFCQKFVSSWKLLKIAMFHGSDGILKGTVYLEDNFAIYPDAFLFATPFWSILYLLCHLQIVPSRMSTTLYGARKPGNSPSDQSWQFSSCSWCPGSCIVWDL